MASLATLNGSSPGSRRDSATTAALVGQMSQLAIGGGRNAIPVLRVGLVNVAGKFLTAETFGFKLNASSRVLKKAQLWIIYADALTPDVVYLQSHLKRYVCSRLVFVVGVGESPKWQWRIFV